MTAILIASAGITARNDVFVPPYREWGRRGAPWWAYWIVIAALVGLIVALIVV
jgi:hypothetical protein